MPSAQSEGEILEKLANVQLDSSYPQFPIKTKARLCSQFGRSIDSCEREVTVEYGDGLYAETTEERWFWRTDHMGRPIESFGDYEECLDDAIKDIRDEWAASVVMEFLLNPSRHHSQFSKAA